MKIAVTYENGLVFQHFGHSSRFKIYYVENGKILSSSVEDTMGQGHGALAGFLKALEVDLVICGGIGPGARSGLSSAGIKLCPGVSGLADAAVQAYLAGDLSFDAEAVCDHHHHHGGGHNCGHNCG